MRRNLEIRVTFSPTRLSSEHLRAAYEAATPVIGRAMAKKVSVEERGRAPEKARRQTVRQRGAR